MTNFFLIWLIATKLIFINPFLVEGPSMEPTLHNKALFLINKKVDQLKRGDIVVFSFGDEYFYVKRIIGLPGDTLRLSKGDLLIREPGGDFKKFNEEYLFDGNVNYGDERYFVVPENEYFVLGDNRNHSKDSRTFAYPYVKHDQIYGKYIYP